MKQMHLKALNVLFISTCSGTKQSIFKDSGAATSQPVLLWLPIPPRAPEGIRADAGVYLILSMSIFSVCLFIVIYKCDVNMFNRNGFAEKSPILSI